MNKTVKKWLVGCRMFSIGFAYIRARNAVYDRVAVIENHPNGLQIEYPTRDRKGYKIKKEFVKWDSIVNAMWYQE